MIRSYQQRIGSREWTDMEGTGQMIPTALGAVGVAPQDATLWILGHRGYRLDIQTPKGKISIRIDGAHGAMQRPDGHVMPIDSSDAITGLVAFPEIEDPAFPASNMSLIDQGVISVDRVSLHRITVEAPWEHTATKGQPQSGTSITDLYFDPTTHLLIKSTNTLQDTDPRLERYLKVITYGNYRTVGGVRIPYLICESLNGQRVWLLQLNHVQFNQGLSQADFHFLKR